MAPQAENSDQTLIELFLDMLAAERGGAKNTLAAYARDLADFSTELWRQAAHHRRCRNRGPARLSAAR